MSNEAARLGAILRLVMGACRFCGCHGGECRIGGGEVCSWLDDLKTLCNNPRCAQRAEIERKKKRFARRRR
jgi:hypothetical protein